MYSESFDVELLGNYPKVGYYVQCGNNKYVCYAEYKGENIIAGYYKTKVYYVKDWDVLYPIQHNNIIHYFLIDSIFHSMI